MTFDTTRNVFIVRFRRCAWQSALCPVLVRTRPRRVLQTCHIYSSRYQPWYNPSPNHLLTILRQRVPGVEREIVVFWLAISAIRSKSCRLDKDLERGPADPKSVQSGVVKCCKLIPFVQNILYFDVAVRISGGMHRRKAARSSCWRICKWNDSLHGAKSINHVCLSHVTP